MKKAKAQHPKSAHHGRHSGASPNQRYSDWVKRIERIEMTASGAENGEKGNPSRSIGNQTR